MNEIEIVLTEDHNNLIELIHVIEKTKQFGFSFTRQDLKSKEINIRSGNWTMEMLLSEMSIQAGLSFRRINEDITVKVVEKDNALPAIEEQIMVQASVSGTITDENGEALPGATIQEKGTTNGTITDVNGKFNLNVPEDAVLTISFVGYETRDVPLNGRSMLDLSLETDIASLQEVVVVGYGTVKKSDLTGSVVSVKSEDIEQQGPKVNVLETILGLAPGLNLTINSNTADQQSVGLLIRGQNSITASNSPLIVLDGVPYSGGLNELNQNDIQSIEVLKDASATAIYGARGANGVILITTKEGKSGKPKLGYNVSYGIREIYNLPPLMNGQEHWDYAVERYSEADISGYPTRLENYQQGNSVDWVDLATRLGKQAKHNLSLEGGTDNFNYFLSGTYQDVEGIAIGDDFKQATIRSNLTYQLTDWLEIGTNTQFSYKDLSGLNANFTTAFYLIPLIDAFDEEGEYTIYPWPEEPIFNNPLSQLNVLDNHYNRNLYSFNHIKIDFPFIEGLSYKLNVGLTYMDTQIGRFWGPNTREGFENNGQAYTEDGATQDRLIENILVYNRAWGKHNINVTALYSSQAYEDEVRSLTTRGFPTNALTFYQPDVAAVIEPGVSFLEQNYISQMGRVNYSFDSKYLFTLTLRRDGYSGFGIENKFGLFPSVALGWNLGDEGFMSDISWLDQLKLRLSFGRNGNQAIQPYQTLARLNLRNYLGGDNGIMTAPGYFPASLASPSLGWETSESLNFGADMAFFSGRLNAAIDYYITNTYDLLLNRSISPVHGITSITQNIGEVKNTGIEINVSSVNIDEGQFKWQTTLSFARNQNEIVDLYGNGEDDVANGWFIGESIQANYGYVFEGVWQETDDIANSSQPGAQPGDIKVQDTDGDGAITPDDRDLIGQTNPKFTAGLNNTISYQNFTLSFVFFTQQGITRVNPLWDTDLVWSDVRRNSIKLNNWSQENPTNEYPANRDGTNPFGVRFYQDASYVRLRDITLGYSFDESIYGKIGLSDLRVFFNMRNPLTFTQWEGLDPELSEQRGIPIDRTYSLGLNLSF